jgi:hypothetical protein
LVRLTLNLFVELLLSAGPVLWILAIIWLVRQTAWSHGAATRLSLPPIRELWVVLVLPLAILLWGFVAAGSSVGVWGREPSAWPVWVLNSLVVLVLVVTPAVSLRHRARGPMLLLLVAGVVGAMLGTWLLSIAWITGDGV